MRTRQALATLLLFASSGCANTYTGKTLWPDQGRTLAASGGRPLPARIGPPGNSVAAELEEPDEEPRSQGTISGRVVDAEGKPVADAEVRLADGSGRGGKVVRVTTDEAGGFTLRGLRRDAVYTLIAEADDGEQTLVGRRKVRSPEVGVRIAVGVQETQGDAEPPRKVGRISRKENFDDEQPSIPKSDVRSPRVNVADLPPAEEAETVDSETRGEPSPTPKVKRVAWRPSEAETAAKEERVDPLPRPSRSQKSTVEAPLPATPEPEGPNPLPPAKERPPGSMGESVPVEPPSEASKATDPRATPEPASPTSGPSQDPFAPASDPPAANDVVAPSKPVEIPSASIPADAGPRKRGTWQDVVEVEAPVQAVANPNLSKRRIVAEAIQGPAEKRGLASLFAARPAKAGDERKDAPVVPATCNFDAKRLRIVDFRLPDLDGKPVKFSELDADYVLIDFWGTWCKPCRESIPHLAELQTRYGPEDAPRRWRRHRARRLAGPEGPEGRRGGPVAGRQLFPPAERSRRQSVPVAGGAPRPGLPDDDPPGSIRAHPMARDGGRIAHPLPPGSRDRRPCGFGRRPPLIEPGRHGNREPSPGPSHGDAGGAPEEKEDGLGHAQAPLPRVGGALEPRPGEEGPFAARRVQDLRLQGDCDRSGRRRDRRCRLPGRSSTRWSRT